MRKCEIEQILESLKKISNISTKLEYNDSVSINQELIKINPLINYEYDKLYKNSIETDCMQVKILRSADWNALSQNLETYTNTILEQLVTADNTIIDVSINIGDNDNSYVVIKYHT